MGTADILSLKISISYLFKDWHWPITSTYFPRADDRWWMPSMVYGAIFVR